MMVKAADLLHNLSSLNRDYRNVGDALFDRFNAPRNNQYERYRKTIETFSNSSPGTIVHFCSSCGETYRAHELATPSEPRCPSCSDLLKEIVPESILEEPIQVQNISVPVFFENRYKLRELIGSGGN